MIKDELEVGKSGYIPKIMQRKIYLCMNGV